MKRAAKRLARRLVTAARRGRPDPDVDPDAPPLYAHRCFAGKVERWHPLPAESATGDAANLADAIFQPPGFVAVDGCVFDLRAEGVYRFYRLPRLSEQRIVWHNDLDSLLSILGYLWVYGGVDDPIEPDIALVSVRRRAIVAACHCLAHLAVTLLASAGVTARPVALASLAPWGGQDDGHTLVEVSSDEKGWLLYDPSFNVCFVEDGRYLSLVDAAVSLAQRRPVMKLLPGNTGHGIYRSRGFDYGFWIDERRQSAAVLYDWYCRIAGVPLICDEGIYTFAADGLVAADRERLTRRYRAIPRDEFLTRFYGAGGSQCVASMSATGVDLPDDGNVSGTSPGEHKFAFPNER